MAREWSIATLSLVIVCSKVTWSAQGRLAHRSARAELRENGPGKSGFNKRFTDCEAAQKHAVPHSDLLHDAVLVPVDGLPREIQLTGHHLKTVASGQVSQYLQL